MLIQLTLLGVLSLSSSLTFAVANSSSSCGDWHPYLDEKCIKIFDETHNFDDAVSFCQKNDESAVISIHSQLEQEFMTKYIFKEKQIVDSVWIGVKFSTGKFKWIDGKNLEFSNWASGKPSNTAEKACAQMTAEGADPGKWVDEPCKKKNLVVCQKMQTWSLAKLQQTLLADRVMLMDSIESKEKALQKKFQDAIDALDKNTVPVGLIYVQLPNEKSPVSIWPAFEWTDVSATYAGVFFRVEGGNAAAFGQIQEENAPRVDQFERIYDDPKHECNFIAGSVNEKVPVNGWSKKLWTGSNSGPRICARIHNSGGEVRPKNMAIRVWKRTG